MFRIVTDTSSNLPTAYLQAENITVIPFTFHTESGEQSCMDTAAFDAKAFYTAMPTRRRVRRRSEDLSSCIICCSSAFMRRTYCTTISPSAVS